MIWAPEASCATFITSMDAYFPVPTMSREENSLPPRTRFVSFMPLAPAHRSYDFHLVTRVEARRRVGALGRDLAVHRHGRVLALDAQVRQQRLHAGALGDLVLFAVHRDPYKQNGRNPRRVRPRSSLARRVPFAGITQSRFEGSRAAPGSQESSPHGDSRSIPLALHRFRDRPYRRGVLERREIARLLTEIRRADHPAHDLGAPRLREIAREEHALGFERLAHLPGDALGELRAQRLRGRLVRPQHDEADDRLALHRVGHADHARLGNGGMAHEHRLDLRGTEALAGDLERVVRASLDEPEAVPVHERPVTVDPDVFPPGPVRLLVASRVLPETLGHSRPRRRHHELAHLTAYRRAILAEAVGRHPGDRPGERARFDRRDREAPEDAARDLGTAGVVDDRQA